MKGPYERLKYDLRRLWECPQCRRRERTEGTVTFLLCTCATSTGGLPISMKLLEESGHRTVPPVSPLVSHAAEPPVGPDTAAMPPASASDPAVPEEAP